MRFELDLFRAGVVVEPDVRSEPTRKELREITDRVIHDALLVNDLPELVRLSAETMAAVATALLRYGQEPAVPDFVEASQALIEQSRAVLDKGLMLRSWETVCCGAVMVEVTVRGICAALSVPYDEVMAELRRSRAAGENANVRRVLVGAGLITEAEDVEGNAAAAT